MCEFTADYKHAEAIRDIRSLVTITSLAYASLIAAWLFRNDRPASTYIWLTFGFGCFLALLWNRQKRHYEGNKKIVLRGDSLSIPSLYFNDKVIAINRLCSVRAISTSGKKIGLWIGERNRPAYVLYERFFARDEDFLLLTDILEGYAKQNLSKEEHQTQSLVNTRADAGEVVLMLVLLSIWVAIYIISSCGSGYAEIGEIFLLAGANNKGVLANQEYYRLLSSFFLHGSILHLLVNITMFSQLGHILVRLVGTPRFLNILLISSLVGTLASSVYSSYAMSIGASGGLYGCFAAYLYLKGKFNNYMPAELNAASMMWLILVLCIDLFCAVFVFSNIDVVNHVGGFAAGFCWCLVAHPWLKVLQPVKWAEIVLCIVLVTLYGYGLLTMLLQVFPT